MLFIDTLVFCFYSLAFTWYRCTIHCYVEPYCYRCHCQIVWKLVNRLSSRTQIHKSYSFRGTRYPNMPIYTFIGSCKYIRLTPDTDALVWSFIMIIETKHPHTQINYLWPNERCYTLFSDMLFVAIRHLTFIHHSNAS